MWQTRARKMLTSLSCLLQMSLWKELFNQSSILHTCSTLLECQQMDRWRKEGPSTKLLPLSWESELKWRTFHRRASRKTSRSGVQVRDKLLRLSLSRKEKRCRRHLRLSWIRSMVCRSRAPQRGLVARARRGLMVSSNNEPCSLHRVAQIHDTSSGACWRPCTYKAVEWRLFSEDNCQCSQRGKCWSHTLSFHLSWLSTGGQQPTGVKQMFTLSRPSYLIQMHPEWHGGGAESETLSHNVTPYNNTACVYMSTLISSPFFFF